MHAHENAITHRAAQALIATQMPDLAELPLTRIGRSGTDNVLFRLGPDLIARFPRVPHAETQIGRIARWLPGLAAALPLAVPLMLRQGVPQGAYPFAWTITPYLPGRPALPLRAADQSAAATALATSLRALQAQPIPPDAPRRIHSDRLDHRLSALEAFLPALATHTDPRRLNDLTRRLRALPPPPEPPVWSHGDLHPLNLLARRGRLTALIDWGDLGVGDPALDLLPAFTLFDRPARDRFLAEMAPHPDAVQRARAVALGKCVHGLPYFRQSNPGFHAVLVATLARVLDSP
jgi:aminoglycoside phosphotransferase (APT) family kinase protein